MEELKIENNHVQNCDEKASAGECVPKPSPVRCWFLEMPEFTDGVEPGDPCKLGSVL